VLALGVGVARLAHDLGRANRAGGNDTLGVDAAVGGRLPYPGSTFDAVIAWHLLDSRSEATYAAALGEIRRVLVPAGWLALVHRHRTLDERTSPVGLYASAIGFRVERVEGGSVPFFRSELLLARAPGAPPDER
jgi:SAM-dependent methyltransferase